MQKICLTNLRKILRESNQEEQKIGSENDNSVVELGFYKAHSEKYPGSKNIHEHDYDNLTREEMIAAIIKVSDYNEESLSAMSDNELVDLYYKYSPENNEESEDGEVSITREEIIAAIVKVSDYNEESLSAMSDDELVDLYYKYYNNEEK